MSTKAFNPRQRSLIRGNILVILSVAIAIPVSNFPHNRPTLILILPTILAIWGTADTVRCMQRRWSWYHAGVILCVYMDLMALSIIVFLLLYPYVNWLDKSH